MPYYTFKNNETNEQFTTEMKIAERDAYLEENPHIEQLIVSAPAMLDSHRLGLTKVPKDFNNLMKKVKKANRGSTINTGNLTEI